MNSLVLDIQKELVIAGKTCGFKVFTFFPSLRKLPLAVISKIGIEQRLKEPPIIEADLKIALYDDAMSSVNLLRLFEDFKRNLHINYIVVRRHEISTDKNYYMLNAELKKIVYL
jgi:hypothetical protein